MNSQPRAIAADEDDPYRAILCDQTATTIRRSDRLKLTDLDKFHLDSSILLISESDKYSPIWQDMLIPESKCQIQNTDIQRTYPVDHP